MLGKIVEVLRTEHRQIRLHGTPKEASVFENYVEELSNRQRCLRVSQNMLRAWKHLKKKNNHPAVSMSGRFDIGA